MHVATAVIVRYDLSRQIAGFDFFHWLLWVRSIGATEIVIDASRPKTDKWDAATTRRRIETIIKPGPALAGLPSRVGTDGEYHGGYLGELLKSAKAGRPIKRLRSILPPGKDRYTVTLRKTQRSPGRNSNEPAWREFAAEIGARVITDEEVCAMPLQELMAIYAGAKMNFGVSNGPVTLGLLSEYPMMAFDFQKSANAIERQSGMKSGEQLPWATKDQIQVWEPDDLPVICKHFYAWANQCATTN
ncbi:MAG: hypothetical protein NUV34_01080 [Sulfuricaulis sp.]|nr:hypothetical protein [Sulfuricaulis sp.]